MLKSRFVRLGGIALGVLGLLGVATPPAQATTVATATFHGTATTGSGLGYPCADDDNLNNLYQLCPQGTPLPHAPEGTPLITTIQTTLPHGLPPNVRVKVHGMRTTTFGFASDICVDAVWNGNKLSKPAATAGPGCTVLATGTVTGWCGLSSGEGSGSVTDDTGNTVTITHFVWNAVGGDLIITGHVSKGNQNGLVVGVFNATPLPATLVPPSGNTCTNLTATLFDVAGAAAVVLTELL